MGVIHNDVGKPSRPGQRFLASRKVPEANRKAIARHNQHVGEIIHAFNAAQAAFFSILCQIIDPFMFNYELAGRVWHSQPSDSSQRTLLEAYVRSSVHQKSIQNGLLWALKAMNELSGRRNDAVHSDMLWHYEELTPGPSTRGERRARLENLPIEKIWKRLRGDLWAIHNYVQDLGVDVMMSSTRPSTKRPRLLLAHTTTAAAQSKRNRAKKAARERQRRSSAG